VVLGGFVFLGFSVVVSNIHHGSSIISPVVVSGFPVVVSNIHQGSSIISPVVVLGVSVVVSNIHQGSSCGVVSDLPVVRQGSSCGVVLGLLVVRQGSSYGVVLGLLVSYGLVSGLPVVVLSHLKVSTCGGGMVKPQHVEANRTNTAG